MLLAHTDMALLSALAHIYTVLDTQVLSENTEYAEEIYMILNPVSFPFSHWFFLHVSTLTFLLLLSNRRA